MQIHVLLHTYKSLQWELDPRVTNDAKNRGSLCTLLGQMGNLYFDPVKMIYYISVLATLFGILLFSLV